MMMILYLFVFATLINVFNVSAFQEGNEDKSQDLSATLVRRILEPAKHKQKNTTISNKDRQRTEENTRLEYRANQYNDS